MASSFLLSFQDEQGIRKTATGFKAFRKFFSLANADKPDPRRDAGRGSSPGIRSRVTQAVSAALILKALGDPLHEGLRAQEVGLVRGTLSSSGSAEIVHQGEKGLAGPGAGGGRKPAAHSGVDERLNQ
jgi:hypothetical protein